MKCHKEEILGTRASHTRCLYREVFKTNHVGAAGVGKQSTTRQPHFPVPYMPCSACRVLGNGAGEAEDEPVMRLLTLKQVRYLLKLPWNKDFRS